MADSMTTVTLGHTDVSRTVTMEVPRSLLGNARGGNKGAQDKLIILFKDEYKHVHRRGLGFLVWRGMLVNELTPPGCDCDCAQCDIGAHCRKPSRGCDM